MQTAGLSQARLASEAGISAATVQQILNGKIKWSRATQDLARVLRVSVDWLNGLQDAPRDSSIVAHSARKQGTEEMLYLFPDRKESDLNGVHALGVSALRFDSFWLDMIAPNRKRVSMARVENGRFAPMIMPGDDILIDSGEEYDGNPEYIWFVKLQGTLTMSRVKRAGDDDFLLSADSPLIPDVSVPKSDIEFIGKVIWQGRRLVP